MIFETDLHFFAHRKNKHYFMERNEKPFLFLQKERSRIYQISRIHSKQLLPITLSPCVLMHGKFYYTSKFKLKFFLFFSQNDILDIRTFRKQALSTPGKLFYCRGGEQYVRLDVWCWYVWTLVDVVAPLGKTSSVSKRRPLISADVFFLLID